ncbi:MAG: Mov34/MPN/PAD-1 family protein [Candidatus Hermodarchaeota archaeon]
MSNEIEIEYQNIIKHFPNSITIGNKITHIKIELIKGIILEISYSKYPKKPKVKLINQSGKVYKKLNNDITSLKNWKIDKHKSVLNVINEIISILRDLQSNIIKIKKELLVGFLDLCRAHHPKEFLGILKMEKNVFTEFILPPGAISSRNTSVFFPGRIPINRDYQGTIHSHPSGNVIPSLQDLNSVFKDNRYHFIAGFPYTLNHIKCYDKNGMELQFKVIN